MGDYDGEWHGGGGYRGRGGYRGGGGGGRYDDGGGYRGQGRAGYYHQPYQGGRSRGGGYQGEYQGNRGGFYDNDFNNWRGGRGGGGGGGGGGGRRGGRYQGDWGRGRGGGRRQQDDDSARRRREEEATLPPDVSFYKEEYAHDKKLACIVVDPAAKMIYTGSADGAVKCWNAEVGTCMTTVDVGGPVVSMLLSGGYLFVGIKKADEGIIKVYNLASGQSHQLPGHKGEVICLMAAGNLLFSGGQDRSVRVWSFNPQAGIFMSQAILTKDEGGHDAPVHCFQTCGNFLFSADREGCIKVWDLATGNLAQTLPRIHEAAITNMLMWENFLLTASMDGTLKILEVLGAPAPNAVIKPEVVFSYDKDQESREEESKIISFAGTLDSAGNPVLMVYYLDELVVRLFEVPSFNARGVLTPAPDTRSLSMMLGPDGKGHMMLVGDNSGKLRIFGWNQMPAAIMQ